MVEWNKRELSYNEAYSWLMNIFHKTRLSENLSVPPNVVYALLYRKPITEQDWDERRPIFVSHRQFTGEHG